jgi:predicted transcriptional regulator
MTPQFPIDDGDDFSQRHQSVDPNLTSISVRIVQAYVSRNTVPREALPGLLQSVYAALIDLVTRNSDEAASRRKPAVPIGQSVFPDHIVCLEDGKQLTSLKRHLKIFFGLTPDEYRERWGLPATYPMVAPNYAAKRSALAKMYGLGRKPAGRETEG